MRKFLSLWLIVVILGLAVSSSVSGQVGVGVPPVPAADSTANVSITDVVGNKADAAQTATTSTRSLMAYIKGLLGPTTVVTGTDNTTTSGTWRQLIASTAATTLHITLDGNIANPGTSGLFTIELGTGAALSEVSIATSYKYLHNIADGGGGTNYADFHIESNLVIAAGTRIVWKPTFGGTVTAIPLGYTVEQR